MHTYHIRASLIAMAATRPSCSRKLESTLPPQPVRAAPPDETNVTWPGAHVIHSSPPDALELERDPDAFEHCHMFI